MLREGVTFLAVEIGMAPQSVYDLPTTERENLVKYTAVVMERKAKIREGMIKPILRQISKVFSKR